jgi:hypothetical protein
MNKQWLILILLNVLVFDLNLILLTTTKRAEKPIVPQNQVFTQPVPPPLRIPLEIGNKTLSHLPYEQVIAQLQTWEKESAGLARTFSYGTSTRGTTLGGIRIGEPKAKKVLITACIHGNEPLATSVVMSYIGHLLDGYNRDPQITKILDEREIWFIPVVSPDSFPSSRFVDGVDPNRNFPGPRDENKVSVAPVRALQKLCSEQKFSAVISGHTWGRVFLTPYGDRMDLCPNQGDYERILGQMTELTKTGKTEVTTANVSIEALAPGFSDHFDPVNIANYYKVLRASQMYRSPIYGSEVDWYYRNGSFAIVMEFGTHQNIPTLKDTTYEFGITWKAFLYFLEEATEVKIPL